MNHSFATVILIAITLIAAIAVAGFVFGLFGTFTSTAQISAGVVTCDHATGICNLSVSNTGTAAGTIGGVCTINVNGVTGSGIAALATGGSLTVAAGRSGDPITCTLASAVGGTVGSALVGTLTLSNGGSAQFSGTWQ